MPEKKSSLPTPLTLMMIVIIIAAISTWLLPAGQYSKLAADGTTSFVITSNTETKQLPFTQKTLDSLGINIALQKFANGDIQKPISVPDTYQKQERRGQGFVQIIEAPVKGIIESIDIVLFILFIGGFMQVFTKTGAMLKGIISLAQRMRGRERLLIVILVVIFSFLGGSYGMDVEAIVFYPVLVPLFIAAGYDLIVPLAIVFGGTCVGVVASFSNPFSVIIASNAAGINWIDGLYERLLFFIIATALLAWYILRYAAKIKKDPTASIVYQVDGAVASNVEIEVVESDSSVALNGKTKLLLVVFFATFIAMVGGIIFLDWWTLEMSALFLGASILIAVIDRMGEKTFINEFITGIEGFVSVALIVGLARGVTVVLNDGLVSDSILYYATDLVQNFSPILFILMVMVFYFFFTVPVSSSSGMAVLTMPIIGALALVANIPGREIVNAYLFGIGIMFLITPTGSVFPSLTMVNVSYKAWLKFIMPMVFGLLLLSSVFLVIGIYVE